MYGALQYLDNLAPQGVIHTLDPFIGMAENIGHFVGVKESEYKAVIKEAGDLMDDFFQTIAWRDPLNYNARYLYRVKFEGKNILFQANLHLQSQA